MKKIIKKIGNSLGIIFNKEECKIYGLSEGYPIEIEDLIKIKIKDCSGGGAFIHLTLPDKIYKIMEEEAKKEGIKIDEYAKLLIMRDIRNENK